MKDESECSAESKCLTEIKSKCPAENVRLSRFQLRVNIWQVPAKSKIVADRQETIAQTKGACVKGEWLTETELITVLIPTTDN